jgi:hypothetical protein
VASLAASYLSRRWKKNWLIEVLAEEISPEIAGTLTKLKGELASFVGAKYWRCLVAEKSQAERPKE